MSIEAFKQAVSDNGDLEDKLNTVLDGDQAEGDKVSAIVKLASDAGHSIQPADVAKEYADDLGELSEESLAMVAGGGGKNTSDRD